MSYTSNLVLLAVDAYEDKDFSGRIYTRYAREPIAFGSSLSLLWQLEKCYDRWRLPENAVWYRNFRDRRGRKPQQPTVSRRATVLNDRKILDMPAGPLPEVEGELTTILLECQQRLHGDWSGRYWLDTLDTETEARQFRSTLELLRLMDQYIASRPRKAGILWGRRNLPQVSAAMR